MKMKIWWFANFYWFSLLIYLNVFMFNFHYADGSSINPFVTTFLLLAICIMVGEFQFVWYMWLAKKTALCQILLMLVKKSYICLMKALNRTRLFSAFF
ncbi:hypothetical protein, partial [Lactobacillus delbrueckii]